MQAQVSNAYIRELVAERDYLKQRNIQLSESLDAHSGKYKAILRNLGYDEEGNPLPKPDASEQPAPIGDQGGADIPEAVWGEGDSLTAPDAAPDAA